MKNTALILIEARNLQLKSDISAKIQQTTTTWLIKELDQSTKDACAGNPAQAFKISPCQTAAHKV